MINIAAVQLDFIPSSVSSIGRVWVHSEPIAWASGAFNEAYTLHSLSNLSSYFGTVQRQQEADLLAFQNRRLEQILFYLVERGVDLCVLPEYSLVVHESTLEVLAAYAAKIVTVCGLGVPRNSGVTALAKFTEDSVNPQSNIAAVFSEDGCWLTEKKHPVDEEIIAVGHGIRCERTTIGGHKLNLAVSICRDYVVAGSALSGVEPTPDLAAIPSYTRNTAAFKPYAPHDFPRVFANHYSAGGSTVFAAGCSGEYSENGLVRPIPPGCEGIVSVNWVHAPEKPTPILRSNTNRVEIRSCIVTGEDASDVSDILKALRAAAQVDRSQAIGPENYTRWVEFFKNKPRLALVADAIAIYRRVSATDILTPALAEQLADHLVSKETETVDELRYQGVESVVREIRRRISDSENVPEADTISDLALSLKEYTAMKSTFKHVSSADAGSAQGIQGVICHFTIGLGRFGSEKAVGTLPHQQSLLSAFARSAPAGSRVVYTLETRKNPATGNVSPHFFISFWGPTDSASNAYFAELERIVRSIYVRGWSLYSPVTNRITGVSLRIVPDSTQLPKASADLSLMADAMCAVDGDCSLQLVGWTLSSDEVPHDRSFSGSVISLPNSNIFLDKLSAAAWFDAQVATSTYIGIDLVLTTPEMNMPLAHLVASELYTSHDWSIREGDCETRTIGATYSVEVALRLLHPPHGTISNRGSAGARELLDRPIMDSAVAPEGALLGLARVERPFADNKVDVRIPNSSRVLHSYVIGRTGSGKTNTLKNIVRHDLGGDGCVIVVDPHGDLYDYALRHGTHRSRLVALDFSGQGAASINPIYWDAYCESEVLANVDSLIALICQMSYFEWAGPRFSDLLQLCLLSLVAVASEDAGDWATVVDVVKLIEDVPFRDRTMKRLRENGRLDLVRRWNLHQKIKDTERAEIEQWFVSKFSVFRLGEQLAAAVSGMPSFDLQLALETRAAIIVKVPYAVLGSEASQILGSIVVAKILRETMNGAFINHSTPAMLIVDEFQNFVGTAFSKLIPEARKFNLALTMANQTLSQLSTFSLHEGSRNESLLEIILGNVGNLVVQGVGRRDAEELGREMGVGTDAFGRIGKHSGLVLLTVDGVRSEPFSVDFPDAHERPGPVPSDVAIMRAQSAMSEMTAEMKAGDFSGFRPGQDGSDTSTDPSEHEQPARSSFLDEWLEKRKGLVRTEGDDGESESGHGGGRDLAVSSEPDSSLGAEFSEFVGGDGPDVGGSV